MVSQQPARHLPIPTSLVAFIVAAYLVALMFADYLSSWFPSIAGYPTGAIVRDALALCVVVLGVRVLSLAPLRDIDQPLRALVAITVVATGLSAASLLYLVVVNGDRVAAILAVRNLTLYLVAAVAVWLLLQAGHVTVRAISNAAFALIFVAAILGIADTLTHGRIVTALGHSPDYAGPLGISAIAGAEASLFGLVRASGGISNALVFGYTMAISAIAAAWFAATAREPWERVWLWPGVVAVLAAMACVSSLTRGAVVALVVGIVVLVVLARRRQVTIAAAGIVLAVAFAAIAIPMLAQRDSEPRTEGNSGVPPIVVRLGEGDALSEASSQARVADMNAGLAALAGHPMGLGLAVVGSAALRAGVENPILTDFYWLMVPVQVGLLVSAFLAVAGLAASLALLLVSWRAMAPLVAIGVAYGIAGFLSGAPDAPVFAGFTSALVVVTAMAGAAHPAAIRTAATTVLRRSPAET